jgi:hypothetical protein
MLSRQAKGSGMQAFTFGQSKARITDPNDKNNKVTFNDEFADEFGDSDDDGDFDANELLNFSDY